jgi:hypothetical protein
MGWRVGVDIGGTFTEVALIEEETGRIAIARSRRPRGTLPKGRPPGSSRAGTVQHRADGGVAPLPRNDRRHQRVAREEGRP